MTHEIQEDFHAGVIVQHAIKDAFIPLERSIRNHNWSAMLGMSSLSSPLDMNIADIFFHAVNNVVGYYGGGPIKADQTLCVRHPFECIYANFKQIAVDEDVRGKIGPFLGRAGIDRGYFYAREIAVDLTGF